MTHLRRVRGEAPPPRVKEPVPQPLGGRGDWDRGGVAVDCHLQRLCCTSFSGRRRNRNRKVGTWIWYLDSVNLGESG